MCLGPSKAPHTLGILVWVFFEPYPSPQCKEGPTRTHTLPPLETRLQCPGPQSSTFRVPAAIFPRSIFWRVDHTVSVHLRAQRIAGMAGTWTYGSSCPYLLRKFLKIKDSWGWEKKRMASATTGSCWDYESPGIPNLNLTSRSLWRWEDRTYFVWRFLTLMYTL